VRGRFFIGAATNIANTHYIKSPRYLIMAIEDLNSLKESLRDLGQRTTDLRGYL